MEPRCFSSWTIFQVLMIFFVHLVFSSSVPYGKDRHGMDYPLARENERLGGSCCTVYIGESIFFSWPSHFFEFSSSAWAGWAFLWAISFGR
jgi:hypothetical protein